MYAVTSITPVERVIVSGRGHPGQAAFDHATARVAAIIETLPTSMVARPSGNPATNVCRVEAVQ